MNVSVLEKQMFHVKHSCLMLFARYFKILRGLDGFLTCKSSDVGYKDAVLRNVPVKIYSCFRIFGPISSSFLKFELCSGAISCLLNFFGKFSLSYDIFVGINIISWLHGEKNASSAKTEKA